VWTRNGLKWVNLHMETRLHFLKKTKNSYNSEWGEHRTSRYTFYLENLMYEFKSRLNITRCQWRLGSCSLFWEIMVFWNLNSTSNSNLLWETCYLKSWTRSTLLDYPKFFGTLIFIYVVFPLIYVKIVPCSLEYITINIQDFWVHTSI
jgi:hypothetical protein